MTPRDRARHYAAIALAVPIFGRWAERALCAQADPDTWFPETSRGDLAAIATRICGYCPVRTQCLDYALAGADTWAGIATGIWGGTTPRERGHLRRHRKAIAA
jgi:WhiB family transcriptional regulator, redox-sensing transcriptional regulator